VTHCIYCENLLELGLELAPVNAEGNNAVIARTSRTRPAQRACTAGHFGSDTLAFVAKAGDLRVRTKLTQGGEHHHSRNNH
jgi:hypothetical protein